MPGKPLPQIPNTCIDSEYRVASTSRGLRFSAVSNPCSRPHATNFFKDLRSQEHDGLLGFTLGPFWKGWYEITDDKRDAQTPILQDAFFQPYLPLQQLDMIKESKSWLCGTTNSIVAQQKEIDLFVDVSPIHHMTPVECEKTDIST